MHIPICNENIECTLVHRNHAYHVPEFRFNLVRFRSCTRPGTSIYDSPSMKRATREKREVQLLGFVTERAFCEVVIDFKQL